MRNVARRIGWLGTLLVAIAAILIFLSRHWNAAASASGHAALDPALSATPRVATIIDRSCADCHSNATRWPWYAHMPGIGWAMKRDVDHAKRVLNFSQFASRRNTTEAAIAILSSVCKMTQTGHMPPLRYRMLHPGVALRGGDSAVLCGWTRDQIARLQHSGAGTPSHPQ